MSCDSRRAQYWAAVTPANAALTTALGAADRAEAARQLAVAYDTALHQARRFPADPTDADRAAVARLWTEWDAAGVARPVHAPATEPAPDSLRAYAAVQRTVEAVRAGTWPPAGTDPADPARAPVLPNP